MSTTSPTTETPQPIIKNENKVLFDKLLEENTRIQDYITLLKQKQVTDIQKYQFNDKKSQLLTTIYNWLFIAYLVGLSIVIYMLFVKSSQMSFFMKIAIILGLLIYPFVIYPLETSIGWFLKMMYSFIVRAPIGEDPIQSYQRNRGNVFVTAKS